MSPSDFHDALEALLAWLTSDVRRGVHGIGVGFKEALGAATVTPAVRVHVVRKRSRRQLRLRDRIPPLIDGITVDVVASPCAIMSAGGVRGVTPPTGSIASGISVGRDGVPFGTLGAIVRSTRPGEDSHVFALSNNHVFANLIGQPGDPVFHPGPGDANGALNRVGTLARAFRIEPGGVIPNDTDAAIARLDPNIVHSLIVQPIGEIRNRTFARVNSTVTKHGRTTGSTRGRVSDVNHAEVVALSHHDRTRKALFKNQIRIVPETTGRAFAKHGDSGSLVLEPDTRQAVGLYFAGPPDGSFGLANDLATVFERLEIAFF